MRSTDQLARGELSWRIAAKCDGGACVRVASAGETIFLGDSKSSRRSHTFLYQE